MNCTEPPERSLTGTWDWSGDVDYLTQIHYTCGPYGKFINSEGVRYETLVSVCEWNKTWTPSNLDPCVAASCPVIPFPPDETGMILFEDPDNVITLESDSAKYSPRLPVSLAFPGAEICTDKGDILMLVGSIPKKSRYPLEIIFEGKNFDEAYHVVLDKRENFVERWGVSNNVTLERQGGPGDGTSVDYDEPFVMKFGCDEDGWTFQVNKDENYPHFFHLFSPSEVVEVRIKGSASISYAGFGPRGEHT